MLAIPVFIEFYGEERYARRIARRICRDRNTVPITTTDHLSLSMLWQTTASPMKFFTATNWRAMKIYGRLPHNSISLDSLVFQVAVILLEWKPEVAVGNGIPIS